MKAARAVVAVAGLAIIAIMVEAGCASAVGPSRRWEGHRISELISKDGPADRIVPYPYGGTLYIWETQETRLAAADASSLGNAPHLESLLRERIFLVDDAGVITKAEEETSYGGRPGSH